MNVRLVSEDTTVHNLCREIRTQWLGSPWQLIIGHEDDGSANGDLYIWDFEPQVGLPSNLRQSPGKHLFLVHRKDLATFQTCLGSAEANILLKPVPRTTLTTFLGLAVFWHAERVSATNGMRADRDELLQCLLQTNLKLQEFDQERTNFLARALHDFRAPLTAITGYCALLVNEGLGPVPAGQKEILQKMTNSARRLSRMASAMFQLSIGRQVNARVDRHESDIRECVDQALHEIYPAIARKDISISIDLDPTDGLFFDPELIEQVLINLLDNASKFAPKSGEVEIRGYPFFWERRAVANFATVRGERRQQCSQAPNAYRVDILNTGLPIPPEHLTDIFEEYTSYSGGEDRSGGGLGLAICRMIVTRHDGRIWAENRDNGPVFSFVLPVEPKKLITT